MQYFGIRYLVDNEDVATDVEYVLVSFLRKYLLHDWQADMR